MPRSINEAQRFLRLVQYIGQYTGPLASLCSEMQMFHWRPLHDKCMEMIKALVCKMSTLWLIDALVKEPIWLICNASVSGVGAMYSQGKTWETCHPAGFMSKKFSPAQFSYKTWDQETLVIMKSLQK